MLKVDLIGRIGSDATVKNFNGKDFIAFNVAHSESYKDAQGNKHERTAWVSCLKPGNATAPVMAYLKKGTQVFVRGDLSTKAYTNDKGLQVGLNLRVSELQLLGGRSEAAQPEATAPGNYGYAPQGNAPFGGGYGGNNLPY